MSLIVEDGTGLANADSYASAATADAYATAMGLTAWATATAGQKDIALRRATQYIDARYTFRGQRVTEAQALQWPREIVTYGILGATLLQPVQTVDLSWPVRAVVNACCELAVRALAGPLMADVEPGSVKREQVGPIATEYFDQGNGGQIRFALVDDMLRAVTAGGRGTVRIERA